MWIQFNWNYRMMDWMLLCCYICHASLHCDSRPHGFLFCHFFSRTTDLWLGSHKDLAIQKHKHETASVRSQMDVLIRHGYGSLQRKLAHPAIAWNQFPLQRKLAHTGFAFSLVPVTSASGWSFHLLGISPGVSLKVLQWMQQHHGEWSKADCQLGSEHHAKWRSHSFPVWSIDADSKEGPVL